MNIFRITIIVTLLLLGTSVCAQEQSVYGDANGADNKYIALTYDDGPDSEVTPKLLDVLKKYDAKATFFVLGEKIIANASTLHRMVTEGHSIGNHGLTHRRLTGLTQQAVNAEIEGVNASLQQITGKTPAVFRPPYAAIDDKVIQTSRANGLAIVLWSIYPESSHFSGASAISEHIISKAHDGDIVFMHDTSSRTIEATERVIKKLSAEGFIFVTVPELIQKNGHLVAGQTYRTGEGS